MNCLVLSQYLSKNKILIAVYYTERKTYLEKLPLKCIQFIFSYLKRKL